MYDVMELQACVWFDLHDKNVLLLWVSCKLLTPTPVTRVVVMGLKPRQINHKWIQANFPMVNQFPPGKSLVVWKCWFSN